jgi:hypothetical protein
LRQHCNTVKKVLELPPHHYTATVQSQDATG